MGSDPSLDSGIGCSTSGQFSSNQTIVRVIGGGVRPRDQRIRGQPGFLFEKQHHRTVDENIHARQVIQSGGEVFPFAAVADLPGREEERQPVLTGDQYDRRGARFLGVLLQVVDEVISAGFPASYLAVSSGSPPSSQYLALS